MLQMAKRQILPVVIGYTGAVADTVSSIKAAGATAKSQLAILKQLCDLTDELQVNVVSLEEAVANAHEQETAEPYRDIVIPAMNAVREVVDQLETMVDAEVWPLPTYAEMLFMK
jgi:glutamine synthetase